MPMPRMNLIVLYLVLIVLEPVARLSMFQRSKRTTDLAGRILGSTRQAAAGSLPYGLPSTDWFQTVDPSTRYPCLQ